MTTLLDTSACIYLLDGDHSDPRHSFMADLLRRAHDDAERVVISPVTYAELLVLPIRTQNIEAEARVTLFATRAVEVLEIGADTASRAASIRATTGLRMPDALIVASAQQHDVNRIVGNDEVWKRLALTTCVHLHIDDQL